MILGLEKYDLKIAMTACSDFPSEAMLWIKEVEMVVVFGRIQSSRIPPSQEEGHEEQKAQKRGLVSTRKTDRLHDLRRLSSDWCT